MRGIHLRVHQPPARIHSPAVPREGIQDNLNNMADDVDSDGEDVDGGVQDWLPPDVNDGVFNFFKSW